MYYSREVLRIPDQLIGCTQSIPAPRVRHTAAEPFEALFKLFTRRTERRTGYTVYIYIYI